MIGPVRPANPVARWLAETWMLFPPAEEYTGWMEQAGFTDVRVRELAPAWYRGSAPYALAVPASSRRAGPSPAAASAARPRSRPRPRCASPRASSPARPRAPCSCRSRPCSPCAHGRAARLTTAAARHRPRPAPALVLWRFSRPHTVIGTALSIVGLYAIAAAGPGAAPGRGDLLATLVAGLAVNIAIVGINQITDVEIDRVNKPFLPIAAGDLSPAAGEGDRRGLPVVPLALALTQGAVETAAVAAGLAVGALYSLPPFRLKRFPVAASLCISGVRSLVVNLGVYWHFAGQIDPPVWALCLFVLPFSLAIAVLKDVPDIEGDRRFSIRTFTVRLGRSGVPAGFGRLVDCVRRDDPDRPPLLADYANPVVLAVATPPRRGCCCTGQSPRIRAITPNSRVFTCGYGRSFFWSTCWSRPRA